MDYIKNLRKHVGTSPLIMVGSGVLVLDSQKRLLLLKRSDNDSWGIPGGAMELGETTEENAKRELREETSLDVNELMLFGVFSGKELYYRYPSGDEAYMVCVVYLTHTARGTVELTDGEHVDFQYFDIAQLPANISPPVRPILKKLQEVYL